MVFMPCQIDKIIVVELIQLLKEDGTSKVDILEDDSWSCTAQFSKFSFGLLDFLVLK